jgi:hypothetical protein
MYILTKSEKKVARQIIEKGLQKEFADSIISLQEIIAAWHLKKTDNRETYHKLYQTIIEIDKHIANRYDNMSGSKYLRIILDQLIDGIITESDLQDFSEVIRKYLSNTAALYMD